MAAIYGNGFSSSLQNLREDIGNLTEELTTLFKDNTDVTASDVKQRLEKIRGDLDDVMSETSAKGRELVEWAHLDGVTDSIEDTVRARPWTVMAIATGMGFMASQALSSSRKESWSRSSARDWTGRAMSDLYQRSRDNVSDAISKTAAKGGELMERANLGEMTDTVEDTARESPWMMLAVAAGLGALASQAWRASRSS